MHIYTMMRAFADSWALLVLTVFFVCVFAWAYRPGSRKVHEDTANIPFRNEDRPMRASSTTEKRI
jgi:cytochrome c oxidase cbb3-type subunit IV